MSLVPLRGGTVRAGTISLLVGLLAVAIGALRPLVSPMLVALVAGLLVANVAGARWTRACGDAGLTRTALRIGIVLLGLRLPLSQLGELGWPVLASVLLVVTGTYAATWWIGVRILRLDPGAAVLVAAGTSVCGAAAIAAVESEIRRRSSDVAAALALVTAFGMVLILAIPVLSAALGLTAVRSGAWAGASIHEVAQVVASSSLIGGGALAVASTIKLARVATLGLVVVASRRLAGSPRDDPHVPLVPWFVWGFAAAVVVRTLDLLPATALSLADLVAIGLLATAMFGLGLTVSRDAIRTVDRRLTVLAGSATAVVALLGLTAVGLTGL
jgi:uncharacterized integral membrane protein (TIGR00698 family)